MRVCPPGDTVDCRCVRSPETTAEEERAEPNWFIDPIDGDDSNIGTTEDCPLQHYSEWQSRVGDGTVLKPAGGILTIRWLGPPADRFSDPVTFRNYLAPGATAFVLGSPKTVLSFVCDGASDRDALNNDRFALTGISVDWPEHMDHLLRTEDGAYASPLEDLGAGDVAVTSWMSIPGDLPEAFELAPDGFMVPADILPTAGTAVDILALTRIAVADMWVAFAWSKSALVAEGIPGGLVLGYVHVDHRDPRAPTSPSFPRALGSGQTIGASCLSVWDGVRIDIPSGSANLNAGAVLFRGSVWQYGSQLFMEGGGFHPREDDYEYPGGLRLLPGGVWIPDGYPICQGKVDFGADIFAPADVQILGTAFPGALGFFGCHHCIVGFTGGSILQETSSAFGEDGYPPAWGKGNSDYIMGGPGFRWTVDQFVAGAAPAPVLPPLEMADGPGGAVAVWADGQADPLTAHAFLHATSDTVAFTPANAMTWANLAVATPAGFLESTTTDGDVEIRYANAGNPGTAAGMVFKVTLLTVPASLASAARPKRPRLPGRQSAPVHPRRAAKLRQAVTASAAI